MILRKSGTSQPSPRNKMLDLIESGDTRTQSFRHTDQQDILSPCIRQGLELFPENSRSQLLKSPNRSEGALDLVKR